MVLQTNAERMEFLAPTIVNTGSLWRKLTMHFQYCTDKDDIQMDKHLSVKGKTTKSRKPRIRPFCYRLGGRLSE